LSKRNVNIALIIGRFPPDVIGGAELQAQQLAIELAQRGHNVTVFTRRYADRPYIEEQDGYLIRRRDELPIPGLRMIWDMVPSVWQLARHKPHIDVLLCYQTLSSGMIGMLAQALLGIPMVLSVRGNREYRLKNFGYQRLVVPPIFSRARRVILQSALILKDMLEQFQIAGKNELAEVVQRKVDVIPNGIHLKDINSDPGSKVVYVGRLIQNKGVADLVKAMKKLPERKLLIIGDGPDRKRLESMSQDMDVTFTGQVTPSEVRWFIQQARVLVLPSYLGDGLPNVILEAMACGVPVVATCTAGIPDLVQHAKTGFLFESGDIQQMVFFINRIFNDDLLWNELSKQSIKAIQAFSWRNVTPRIEKLLLEVIDQAEDATLRKG
jgi:glycosyltransferase involved in cell wall biosynthesis